MSRLKPPFHQIQYSYISFIWGKKAAGVIYQLMCISRVLYSTQGVIVSILVFRNGNCHDLVYSGNTSTVIYRQGDDCPCLHITHGLMVCLMGLVVLFEVWIFKYVLPSMRFLPTVFVCHWIRCLDCTLIGRHNNNRN